VEYADFAPEPSTVELVHIAYSDTTSPGEPIRRTIFGAVDMSQRARNEFLTRYAGEVSLTADHLEDIDTPALQRRVNKALVNPPLELSKKAGLRTVGAFVLLQSADRERFYHGLVIPLRTYLEVPLLFRENILEIIKTLDQSDEADEKGFPDFAQPLIDDIKQNGPITREVGFRAASMHMASVHKLAYILASLRKNEGQ